MDQKTCRSRAGRTLIGATTIAIGAIGFLAVPVQAHAVPFCNDFTFKGAPRDPHTAWDN
jgi:hypothetical protein